MVQWCCWKLFNGIAYDSLNILLATLNISNRLCSSVAECWRLRVQSPAASYDRCIKWYQQTPSPDSAPTRDGADLLSYTSVAIHSIRNDVASDSIIISAVTTCFINGLDKLIYIHINGFVMCV